MSNIYKNLGLLTYVGLMMILPVIGGILLGQFIDKRFDTGNIFLFVFIIIGVVTSFLNLYRIAMGSQKRK